MRFIIHDGESDDSLVVEGETIEEIQKIGKAEADKRRWKDCWSEELKPCSLSEAARVAGVKVTEVIL